MTVKEPHSSATVLVLGDSLVVTLSYNNLPGLELEWLDSLD